MLIKRLLAGLLLISMGAALISPWSIRRAVASEETGAPGASAFFDVQAFLARQPGILKDYNDGRYRAAQVIQGYGTYYSLDPRILLTLLELVPHLITSSSPDAAVLRQPFGSSGPDGFASQIDWAAREVRAGFGPYSKAPEVQFKDGSSATLRLDQDPSLLAVQRFLAGGRTQSEWTALSDQYTPLFLQLFGAKPETVTPAPAPSAGRPFLGLPWPRVYPAVAGDPLARQPVRMVHSSYFDHAYPTVDRGPDGNNFVVNYLNQGNVSYNSHDANDYYFPDRPAGTPIVAAADGIAYAWTARGNGVVIRHSGAYAGYETVYWHLDAFEQKFSGLIDTGKGVPVRAGDYLGTSGKSGFTDGGAHLHFEVRHNGKQVDPYGWFGPGSDPCAAWTQGCEASVWLWDDSLRGLYDFTMPGSRAPKDSEPPVGTLSIVRPDDPSLLVHFDGHPVQSLGAGTPAINGGDLKYEEGVFDRAVRMPADVDLSYPIAGNLDLRRGTLVLWAKLPDQFEQNGTERNYLFGASSNPGDSARGVYTGTLALRREQGPAGAQWNFWTVAGDGTRSDLIVTDTLKAGWHQFAVTWDAGPEQGKPSGTKRLFIDGMAVATARNVPLPSAVGDKLEIGRWTAGYGASNAAFDELAVFRRPLSETEVRQLAERRDFHTGVPGPLAQTNGIVSRSVVLDTNAIDRQGGVVSVRLRRDEEPWGDPVPFYDSYRWSIVGAEGEHTFSAEFRDRADNVTVVTTTLTFTTPPTATMSLTTSSAVSATLKLSPPTANATMQVSQDPTFGDAVWQPAKEDLEWTWQSDRPKILYVRFQTAPGVFSETPPVGQDMKKYYLPLAAR